MHILVAHFCCYLGAKILLVKLSARMTKNGNKIYKLERNEKNYYMRICIESTSVKILASKLLLITETMIQHYRGHFWESSTCIVLVNMLLQWSDAPAVVTRRAKMS